MAKKTIGAPSPVKGEGVAQEKNDYMSKDFPLSLKATNNTPIPLYLSEAGVLLPANFDAPKNTLEVTFATPDHLQREVSNVEAIAKVHGFESALLLEEIDSKAAAKDAAAGASPDAKADAPKPK